MVVGGGPRARFWHPWLGRVFFVSVAAMHKMWRKDMLETDADRAWWKAVDHYIRNQDDQLPPIGRFNYGQKLFFWVMFYGAILLVLSGAVLWFVESIPWSLRWVRYLAVFLHVASAMGDDRWFYNSRLHGHGHGARRLHLDHSRRSLRDLGLDAPSALVSADHPEQQSSTAMN